MELTTERLILRTITMDDLEDIHKLHSYPEVDEFNTVGIPKDLEETRKMVEPYVLEQSKTPQKNYSFKISLKDNNKFIGLSGINLSLDKFRLGEIFYKLMPQYWNKGYATEVSKVLIKTGFESFGLHKIEAGTTTDNYRSMRVLEKSGMVREGLRRKILPIRGEWKDGYLFAIVEDDPR